MPQYTFSHLVRRPPKAFQPQSHFLPRLYLIENPSVSHRYFRRISSRWRFAGLSDVSNHGIFELRMLLGALPWSWEIGRGGELVCPSHERVPGDLHLLGASTQPTSRDSFCTSALFPRDGIWFRYRY